MRAKEYIRYLLSLESYSFSLDEIGKNISSEGTALKSELARLVNKNEIMNLRKGYYLIIPPRYSKVGFLPIQLYIDKLAKELKRNYYLGFYTAAKFHGASHQQIQSEYVMIEKPKLADIHKGEVDIRFMTSSKWPTMNIIEKKSDAGLFKISSPSLTAVDLIHHQTKLGGLSRMLAVLEELSDEITDTDLNHLLSWYPHRSTLQRFGFILEELQTAINTNAILDRLKSNQCFPILLSPRGDQKPGSVNNKWKVDVNIKLENDL